MFIFLTASGYARSDGVVVLYIQKATDAKRSYASIVNVATMFNGNREGNLLTLDVPSMVNFMKDFYKNINVKPEDVEYVEAYGCAHKVNKQFNSPLAMYAKYKNLYYRKPIKKRLMLWNKFIATTEKILF